MQRTKLLNGCLLYTSTVYAAAQKGGKVTSSAKDGKVMQHENVTVTATPNKGSQQIGNKVKEASSTGDAERAVLELERLIAQKRRME